MKIKLSVVRNLAVVVLLVIVSFSGGYFRGVEQGKQSVGSVAIVGETGESVDMSLFWEVWNRLDSTFLDGASLEDKQKMVYGAISGLTSSLGDPYTSFLPPADNLRTKEDLAGEFAGVGIQLGFIDKTLAVMSPLPNNPAIKAGIEARDLIIKIKDEGKNVEKDTMGMNLADAIALIRGEKGTKVTLTVLSEKRKEPADIEIVRDTIEVPTVELSWVGNVAHIRVTRFGEQTLTEWVTKVDEIVKRMDGGKFDGVVLDLRNNPGGFMKGAVDLAGEFIPSGIVVSQEGKESIENFSVARKGRLIGAPLVVLVNGGSASAAEILAGALKDNLGVSLVGENTFGKGTVQEALDLPGGAGLHVTIARWLLPDGSNIHEVGIVPDVEVGYVYDPDNIEFDNQLEKAVEVLLK
jgi:carboxyl-terminal processing protease